MAAAPPNSDRLKKSRRVVWQQLFIVNDLLVRDSERMSSKKASGLRKDKKDTNFTNLHENAFTHAGLCRVLDNRYQLSDARSAYVLLFSFTFHVRVN